MPDGGQHVLDTLAARGFVALVSDEHWLRERLAQPTTYYTGFDPTGPSLTAGHLVPVMMMAHLQRAGHRPIVLSGGGTALIGDPSGKTSSRPMMTAATIAENLASQRAQLTHFLTIGDDAGLVVNNADWLTSIKYIEFLRDYGRLFSVNQMLTADIYRTRLDQNLPLSFLEFNYMLLQAFDFLHLYREYGCRLQCAGQDQWANCLAGMDLIRRVEGAESGVLCTPLLVTASGQKMGKTERGAVYLNPAKTSPYEFYQYFVNIEDADVATYLRLLTFVPLAEIDDLTRVSGAALNVAKQRLAWELTAMVHSEAAANEASEAARSLFGGGDTAVGAPTVDLPLTWLETPHTVVDLFTDAGLAQSRAEVKRLVDQGGCYVNGDRVSAVDLAVTDDLLVDGSILLRAGKKRYLRVRFV